MTKSNGTGIKIIHMTYEYGFGTLRNNTFQIVEFIVNLMFPVSKFVILQRH